MPPARKPVFVHLGNIGFGRNIKTERYAKRFPGTQFVGIDLKPHKGSKPHNWRQIEAEFVSGLERLEDNSVDHISSELALGMYREIGDRFGGRGASYHVEEYASYTAEVLNVAYKKLRIGGKIRFVIGDEKDVEMMQKVLSQTPFSKENISVRLLPKSERNRTPWMKALNDLIFHEITAEK